MAWVRVSCPSCYVTVSINGIRRHFCGALLIYRPSPRRKSIDIKDTVAFQWWADENGKELVHLDNGKETVQERGMWIRAQGDVITFERRDGRRTARHVYDSWWMK